MTSKHPPVIRGEEEFFLNLRRAASIVERMTDDAVLAAGLTVAQYSLLRVVQNTPGVTASEARKRLYISAPSMTNLTDGLLRKGFLRRTKDPNHGRRMPLLLTGSGNIALQRAESGVLALVREAGVPQSLLSSLTKGLSSLLSSLPPYGRA